MFSRDLKSLDLFIIDHLPESAKIIAEEKAKELLEKGVGIHLFPSKEFYLKTRNDIKSKFNELETDLLFYHCIFLVWVQAVENLTLILKKSPIWNTITFQQQEKIIKQNCWGVLSLFRGTCPNWQLLYISALFDSNIRSKNPNADIKSYCYLDKTLLISYKHLKSGKILNITNGMDLEEGLNDVWMKN